LHPPFSCPHCGLKLKVKEEHAGKSARCPTCKQPLTVPMPSATVAWTPPAQLDGAVSSLAKLGHDGGITLEHDAAGRKPTTAQKQRSVSQALAGRKKAKERYLIDGEIARGGMGAVLRAIDADLRREVAVKYLLDDKDPKKKARFFEEAQINAQLEHPNIVPVHDLRVDPQGRPYLMMKLVKGRDLKSVLDDLRGEGEPGRVSARSTEKDWTLGRLLNVLVNVCNGLAFAHAHGVVHRDLKPANIMLGDFGEVYIMDWGLAKVLAREGEAPAEPPAHGGIGSAGASPSRPTASSSRSSKVVTSRQPEADLTQEGSVLGTPLYMPPEQAKGDLHAIDQRSDVYALGAILYEMLTLQPPIDKEGGYLAILMRVIEGEIVPPEERIKLPLSPAGERAGVRGRLGRWRNPARHVPPELSAIAMKALAKEKERRYASAKAFRRDLELYMEGRSVSAKRDSFREQLWKLMKRNKGASIATAAALVVLLVMAGFFLRINYTARLRAEEARKQADANYASFQGAVKKSVGPLLRSARLHLRDREYDEACQDVELATLSDADHAEARLLKAQLLLVRQQYDQARELLAVCCRHDPKNQAARELLDACGQLKPDPSHGRVVLAEVFTRQQQFALADGVLAGLGRNPGEAREKLLALYRQRLEKALGKDAPGRLTLNAAGEFSLNLNHWKTLDDLTPLKGMPLTSLDLRACGRCAT
jgi:serine/threonine protein kinase